MPDNAVPGLPSDFSALVVRAAMGNAGEPTQAYATCGGITRMVDFALSDEGGQTVPLTQL